MFQVADEKNLKKYFRHALADSELKIYLCTPISEGSGRELKKGVTF